MNLNDRQIKLLKLTRRLELKTEEYNKLCKRFDFLKSKNTPSSSIEYQNLLLKMEINAKEIAVIQNELRKINI